ncbi:MAG: TIGR04282 family arsenosugar biosynthesis glycosyltransferase [Pyrinomonadaceae bacterium]
MAKVPRAGNVKTRLQPFLSPEKCRTLAEAFVLDAINKTQNVCDQLVIAFAPASEKNYFNNDNLILIEQTGADLGAKMFNAFEFAFHKDSDANVVLVGTDSPTFPAEFIIQAFEKLETRAEIVLGESDDGGFYLIGLRNLIPKLFDKIEWSSPRVYRQITRNIDKLKADLQTIPAWYDVDNPNDLQRLREEILQNEKAQKTAPETFQWLLANANFFLIAAPENKS